ncbi:MAG: AMP-binding protein [Kibdelosporangium sp.]
MSQAGINARLHQNTLRIIENSILTEALLFPRIHERYLKYRELLGCAPAEHRQLSLERLQEQLKHATAQVPAYRDLDPQAPIEQWPFITKADIRDRLADFCDDAIDPGQCRSGRTSGTTGIPIMVVHDFEQIVHKYALALRRNEAIGLPMRRRILQPMRDGALPWTEYPSPAQGNSIVVQFGSADHAGGAEEVIRRARDFQPDVVSGHPSNCLRFVEAIAGAGVDIVPRQVVTYGEALGPGVRDRLENGLGALVHDGYGMREFGTIAVQCEKRRYHVESERLLVEIVDEHGRVLPPGELGEIVVTDLVNGAMPLIRYRTGDSARLAATWCECGYPGEVLADVGGRDLGVISLPGGEIPINALTRVVRRFPLRRFQIVRREAAVLEVLISVSDATAGVQNLAADLTEFVDQVATVSVRVVGDDGFLVSESGKDTDYVSLV